MTAIAFYTLQCDDCGLMFDPKDAETPRAARREHREKGWEVGVGNPPWDYCAACVKRRRRHDRPLTFWAQERASRIGDWRLYIFAQERNDERIFVTSVSREALEDFGLVRLCANLEVAIDLATAAEGIEG